MVPAVFPFISNVFSTVSSVRETLALEVPWGKGLERRRLKWHYFVTAVGIQKHSSLRMCMYCIVSYFYLYLCIYIFVFVFAVLSIYVFLNVCYVFYILVNKKTYMCNVVNVLCQSGLATILWLFALFSSTFEPKKRNQTSIPEPGIGFAIQRIYLSRRQDL